MFPNYPYTKDDGVQHFSSLTLNQSLNSRPPFINARPAAEREIADQLARGMARL